MANTVVSPSTTDLDQLVLSENAEVYLAAVTDVDNPPTLASTDLVSKMPDSDDPYPKPSRANVTTPLADGKSIVVPGRGQTFAQITVHSLVTGANTKIASLKTAADEGQYLLFNIFARDGYGYKGYGTCDGCYQTNDDGFSYAILFTPMEVDRIAPSASA